MSLSEGKTIDSLLGGDCEKTNIPDESLVPGVLSVVDELDRADVISMGGGDSSRTPRNLYCRKK